MYVVTVDFEIHDQFADRFQERVLKQAKDSLAREANCTCFDVCINPDVPGHFFLYEIYSSPADFQDHLESSHFLDFNKTVSEWVENKTVRCFHKLSHKL